MRKLLILILLTAIISCSTKNNKSKNVTEGDLTEGSFQMLADSVTYNVIIKAEDPNDEWVKKSLSRLQREEWLKQIIEKIQNGSLTAYNYDTHEPLSIQDIEQMKIDNNNRMEYGMVQFSEDWAFDSTDMKMYKKVRSAIFGYERYNDDGEVRGHKAAFIVHFK